MVHGLHEKFMVAELVKELPAFYGTQGSLPCLQKPAVEAALRAILIQSHRVSLKCISILIDHVWLASVNKVLSSKV
jgi:hypothetical protein